jgi:ABC-type glycerol-3-phosphate transport system substrate-binding protein
MYRPFQPKELCYPVRRNPIRNAGMLLFCLLIGACQALPTTPTSVTSATKAPSEPARQAAAPTHTPVPGPSGTPTSLPQLWVKTEDLKGIVVHFYHPWTEDAAKELAQAVADFNQQNIWGIRAEITAPGSESALFSAVDPLLGTKDSPNLVAAPTDLVHHWQTRAKTVIDLQDYADDPTWGFTPDEKADFTSMFWQQDVLEKHLYGIPASRNFQVLFYNQTWARELGFNDAPSTPEEFNLQACAAAKAIKKDNTAANDGTGGWIVNSDSLVAASWLTAFGVDPLPGADGKGYTFDTDASRSAFQFLRKMFDDGCAWISRLPTPYDYFATRQALFYSGSLEDIAVQKAAIDRAGSGDEWTVIPYPQQSSLKSSAAAVKPVVLAEGYSYTIFAASKEEQLAAWLLLRWLCQPEYQSALTRASGTLPVGVKALDQLSDYSAKYPQWAQTLLWIPAARPAPTWGTWYQVSSILEDAFWQSFQSAYIKPEGIPDLLKTLDATIPEVLKATN